MVGIAPNSANCVAYWKMEDNTDSSGNSNTLTINGVTSTPGILNNGYSFDGDNDNLVATDNLPTDGSNMSVSVWVKFSFLSSTTQWVWSQHPGTALPGRSGILLLAGKVAFYNSSIGVLGNFTPTIDTWYNIVFTYDGTTTSLFINNILEDSTTATFTSIPNVDLVIGSLADNSLHFNGVIDEMSIYNTALTTNNIAYLYNAGAPTTDQQYPFSGSTPLITNLRLGSITTDTIFLGDVSITTVYLGSTKVLG